MSNALSNERNDSATIELAIHVFSQRLDAAALLRAGTRPATGALNYDTRHQEAINAIHN